VINQGATKTRVESLSVAAALGELERFGVASVGVSRAVPVLGALYTQETEIASLRARLAEAERERDERTAELHAGRAVVEAAEALARCRHAFSPFKATCPNIAAMARKNWCDGCVLRAALDAAKGSGQ